MALASQTARLSEVGRSSFRTPRARRRTRLAPIGAAALLIAGLGAVGWLWLGDHGPKQGPDTPADQVRDPLAATFTSLPSGGGGATPGGGTTGPGAAPAGAPQNPTPQEPLSVISMGASKSASTMSGGSPALANRNDPAGAASPPSASPQIVNPAPAAAPSTSQPGGSQRGGAQPASSLPTGSQPVSPPPSAAPSAPPPAPVSGQASAAIGDAERLVASNRLVEARIALNAALAASPTGADAAALRDRIARINETLVFSPTVAPGDTLSEVYAVQPGDTLVRIAANNHIATDWRLIQRINRMADPRRLTVGQKLKLLRGPFHAVVSKSDYRLDLYAGESGSPGERVFIRSFRVGLGENNSTPLGNFVIRPQSKLVNPTWANPRTGEFFAADNPKNPIGERWIGLDPADAAAAAHTQYGLHGTVEPDSIGQQKSMGCVRLLPDDIALLYELLVDKASTVKIEP